MSDEHYSFSEEEMDNLYHEMIRLIYEYGKVKIP